MTGPDASSRDATGPDDAAQGATTRILLVGMMGAGKTTTGRLVAHRFGWDYLDSDVEVEKKTGLSVPALFARDGELAFRDAEAEVLREACARTDPVVISVAGGAVLRPETRDLLRASGRVIWLRARPATLAERVGDGVGRPLLDQDPGAALLALDAVRRPLYAEVADETIDVDDLSPDEVGGRIIAGIEAGDRP
jgi:shikimate kinase